LDWKEKPIGHPGYKPAGRVSDHIEKSVIRTACSDPHQHILRIGTSNDLFFPLGIMPELDKKRPHRSRQGAMLESFREGGIKTGGIGLIRQTIDDPPLDDVDDFVEVMLQSFVGSRKTRRQPEKPGIGPGFFVPVQNNLFAPGGRLATCFQFETLSGDLNSLPILSSCCSWLLSLSIVEGRLIESSQALLFFVEFLRRPGVRTCGVTRGFLYCLANYKNRTSFMV